MGSTTTLNKNVAKLLHLLLGTAHGSQLDKLLSKTPCQASYALLGQLAGAFILAVLQQLHNTTFIRGESGDLTNEVADELDTLSETLNHISIQKAANKRRCKSPTGHRGSQKDGWKRDDRVEHRIRS